MIVKCCGGGDDDDITDDDNCNSDDDDEICPFFKEKSDIYEMYSYLLVDYPPGWSLTNGQGIFLLLISTLIVNCPSISVISFLSPSYLYILSLGDDDEDEDGRLKRTTEVFVFVM